MNTKETFATLLHKIEELENKLSLPTSPQTKSENRL